MQPTKLNWKPTKKKKISIKLCPEAGPRTWDELVRTKTLKLQRKKLNSILNLYYVNSNKVATPRCWTFLEVI